GLGSGQVEFSNDVVSKII
ncbi:unnamed protein product, partial [Diplocarpon coronariae]